MCECESVVASPRGWGKRTHECVCVVASLTVEGEDARGCMRPQLPPSWGDRRCMYALATPSAVEDRTHVCVCGSVRGFLRGVGRARTSVYAAAASSVVGKRTHVCMRSQLPLCCGERTHVCISSCPPCCGGQRTHEYVYGRGFPCGVGSRHTCV